MGHLKYARLGTVLGKEMLHKTAALMECIIQRRRNTDKTNAQDIRKKHGAGGRRQQRGTWEEGAEGSISSLRFSYFSTAPDTAR